MTIWGILIGVGILFIFIGAVILIAITNTTFRKIGGLFLGLGIILFIIGIIGSYTILSATSETIREDPNYRRREQEGEEGDKEAVAKTLVVN